MNLGKRIAVSLLLLRLGVFIVMFFWTVDKFLRPQHAAGVFENFYLLSGMGPKFFYIVGALQMALILAFLFGLWKRFTYGLIFILHGISTLSSYNQYLHPFEGPHLLFFAAWPMWAACFALYYLRDMDNLGVLQKSKMG